MGVSRRNDDRLFLGRRLASRESERRRRVDANAKSRGRRGQRLGNSRYVRERRRMVFRPIRRACDERRDRSDRRENRGRSRFEGRKLASVRDGASVGGALFQYDRRSRELDWVPPRFGEGEVTLRRGRFFEEICDFFEFPPCAVGSSGYNDCVITRWCNGSTRDFGSLCRGSNPCRVV